MMMMAMMMMMTMMMVTRLCSSKGWKMKILMVIENDLMIEGTQFVVACDFAWKEIHFYWSCAQIHPDAELCWECRVTHIPKWTTRWVEEAAFIHKLLLEIFVRKKCAKKEKFILFIQVEFSWTKNGRFIDTTTGHVHFESKDNGESFGVESNESLPLGIMILSPITREHHHLQCRARWRGSLSVCCLQFWGSCVLQG